MRTTNYRKLGLFVVVGLSTVIWSVLFVGSQRLYPNTVPRVTYFDESVQGLEVGAPVKMRGVTFGTVSEITIAPDRRLVEVTASIYVDLWVRLGLGTEEELRLAGRVPEDLRAQVASTGITGVKFLLVDFFPNADPSPVLLFPPPYNYIPSTRSTLKSLEETFVTMSREVPALMSAAEDLIRALDEKLGELDVAALNQSLEDLLVRIDGLVVRADAKLADVDARALSEEASILMSRLEETARRLNDLLRRTEAGEGPLGESLERIGSLAARSEELVGTLQAALTDAQLPATTEALRETASTYTGLGSEAGTLVVEAEKTLALLREALEAIGALASYLERQPGALIRGRVPDQPPPGPNR